MDRPADLGFPKQKARSVSLGWHTGLGASEGSTPLGNREKVPGGGSSFLYRWGAAGLWGAWEGLQTDAAPGTHLRSLSGGACGLGLPLRVPGSCGSSWQGSPRQGQGCLGRREMK